MSQLLQMVQTLFQKDVSNSQAAVKLSQHRTLYTKEYLALCTTVNETIPCHLSVTGYSVYLHRASWHKTVTSLICIQKVPGSNLGQIIDYFDGGHW